MEKIELPPRVHSGSVAKNERGAVNYSDGSDNSHPTEEQRQMVEECIGERHDLRGGWLEIVEVQVYEHDGHEQVTIPHGSLLGVETDACVISEIVVRASAELADWRSRPRTGCYGTEPDRWVSGFAVKNSEVHI